jgi:hypothetical protein
LTPSQAGRRRFESGRLLQLDGPRGVFRGTRALLENRSRVARDVAAVAETPAKGVDVRIGRRAKPQEANAWDPGRLLRITGEEHGEERKRQAHRHRQTKSLHTHVPRTPLLSGSEPSVARGRPSYLGGSTMTVRTVPR